MGYVHKILEDLRKKKSSCVVAFSKRVARMGSHIFVILGVRKFR